MCSIRLKASNKCFATVLSVVFSCFLGGCGPTATVVKESHETAPVKESRETAAKQPDVAERFDTAFAQNIEAASDHYWHAIDCEKRDENTGMPTTPLLLPGAATSFVDSTEYTATHVFVLTEGASDKRQAFVAERFKANVPEGFELHVSDESTYHQMNHQLRPDDFVSVDLSVDDGMLYVTFRPQAKDEIPAGNPCIKPDIDAVKARFDAMRKAVETNDESLFKAQWHLQGYEENLVGASGIPGATVFAQAHAKTWVLEPDLKSLRHIPQRPEDAWLVACSVVQLSDGRVSDQVWMLIADGKILGGGEERDNVQALAWRWATKMPLAP